MSREHPGLGEGIGDGLAQRYLKETGEASRYEDARSGEGRRRLSVRARDVYRLVDRFRGTAVAKMEEYGLLERLLHEQCHVGRHRDGRPGADDDDAAEGKVPIALKEAKEVRSSSMQTPHDPEVTYSGHKGKGYEVQVSEDVRRGERRAGDHPRGGDAVERQRRRCDGGGDRQVEGAWDRSFGAVVRHVVWIRTQRMGGRA